MCTPIFLWQNYFSKWEDRHSLPACSEDCGREQGEFSSQNTNKAKCICQIINIWIAGAEERDHGGGGPVREAEGGQRGARHPQHCLQEAGGWEDWAVFFWA